MFTSTITAKRSLITMIAASALLIAATAVAGPKSGKVKPGKPGELNILDTALLVNSVGPEDADEGVGEFAYLYGAVLCLQGEQLETVLGLLTGEDKVTLFAPTNEAFRNLQRTLTGNPDIETSPELSCAVNDILENEDALFTVLAYHLTEGRRFSNSVFNANNSKEIEMLAAGSIFSMPDLTIMDGSLQNVGLVLALDSNPEIGLVNVNASNGVIHTIDTVLLPKLD
jgi:uncharacterized surface protein with fasciclin (FAS1) repeats